MSWILGNKKLLPQIINYLEKREWERIQQLSFFTTPQSYHYPNKNEALILLNMEKKGVSGIIVITSKGLIFPIFSPGDSNKIDEIKILFNTVNVIIHGVIGLKQDVDFFNKMISKQIKAVNNYVLMHRESMEYFANGRDTAIYLATPDDLSKLLPLEIEYQKEEVLLNPNDLNRRAIMYQLLKELINEQLKIGYSCALFVKENNSSARHLYTTLGFIEPVLYQINYYNK
ncbi:MAG: hypothetical protein B6229_04875 [Spirochaetaceae bacterium 4572_7]|nr:MAG: hypothetical protein B6229_04875 [Spirochaetaceae bacterium 4572_7]